MLLLNIIKNINFKINLYFSVFQWYKYIILLIFNN